MIKNAICEEYGMKVPVFAFTHSPDVVIAVSNAGGMGVLGASGMTPEEFDLAMQKITEACPGKSFGVDLILPNKYVGMEEGGLTLEALQKHIPQGHKDFLNHLLEDYEVSEIEDRQKADSLTSKAGSSVSLSGARALANVAFNYPIKLLVNALGIFPAEFRERAHAQGIKIGALVGQVKHALKQKEAGVDIVIAQGYEAGGHTGDIANTVLVPQVVDAVAPIPVIMAGGVADGRQIAAAMALGAQGVWTGSVWLMTEESETHPVVKKKFAQATSADTLRSRSSTGKHARQLKSAWTDAWEDPKNPDPLPMPIHGLLISEAKLRIEQDALKGKKGATELVNYFVGQNVGMLTEEKPAAEVLNKLVKEYETVMEKLGKTSSPTR
ncbi:nitronate monooxygenase [Bacillus sp. ISL-18]|uniref:NAD(P)H-dependent flavin oxidoreductase n=1 Tax=Bacillus sp. ISL-18 TaxID=2819118 RepID=UPI001BE66FB9|nr:nitronate monooxygenase family protein [Bacillus sp. ISL-18]MBT2655952.1 nitronate monooxygenase [Bacillus sp. ISL-18]